MSNISDKLDYLDGTKSAIKNALLGKEVPITSETTFREYADLITNMTVGRKICSFIWNIRFSECWFYLAELQLLQAHFLKNQKKEMSVFIQQVIQLD